MSTPNSTIHLVSNCPLDNRNAHTIRFVNQSAQLAYFDGKRFGQPVTGQTYLRKTANIRVAASYDMLVLNGVNYLYFINSPTGKPYFYFINSKHFINPTTTLLVLELDVLQTYMFDYSLAPCYVEREHASDEGRYNKEIDEALELGEYVTAGALDMTGLNTYAIIVQATLNPGLTTQTQTVQSGGNFLNGIFSGVGLYAVETQHLAQLNNTLGQLDSWGKSDGILQMWMYPKGLIGLQDGYVWGDTNVFKPLGGLTPDYTEIPLFPPEGNQSMFQGYTPRNSKLYDFPYNMLYVTNNQGQAMVIQPEYNTYASGAKYGFVIRGSYGTDSAIKLIPLNYKGEEENFEEGLTIDNFPTCAWTQDAYKIWLAQNSRSIDAQIDGANITRYFNNQTFGARANDAGNWLNQNIVDPIMKAFGANSGQIDSFHVGAASGSSILPGISGANGYRQTDAMAQNQIAQINAKVSEASIQPPHSKGQYGNSTLNVAAGKKLFSAKYKTIDYQHAKMIDDFFTLYGYKCQCVKVPNVTGRENWNYTKTIGCHVVSGLDAEDSRKLEAIFDSGITFWHNPDNYMNYGVSNGIIS